MRALQYLMRTEIRSLTALRFVAALWVFLFHVDLRWPLELPRAVEGVVQQGAVGMSLFFILSGFVLAHNYAAPGRKYLWSRFARIYPVYTLAALVTIPFFSLNGDVSVWQVAFAAVADVFMLQAWFPPLFPLWNFGASWSLSAEAFFYGVFPLGSADSRTRSWSARW